MTVGANVHAGERSSLWLNASWDIGCVLVFAGTAVVIEMLCRGARLRSFLPRRSQSASRLGQSITGERLGALLPKRPEEAQPSRSPVLLKIVDEDWKIVDGRLWVAALAVTFINTTDKPITLTRFTFESRDRSAWLRDHVDDEINRKAAAELGRMIELRAPDLFTQELLLRPLAPVTKWVIDAALPLPEGGRPACLLRFEDTLGDTYEVHLDRRPMKRFNA